MGLGLGAPWAQCAVLAGSPDPPTLPSMWVECTKEHSEARDCFESARATKYAPNEIHGIHGLHGVTGGQCPEPWALLWGAMSSGSTWGQPLWDDDEWSEKSYGMEWHKEQLQKHNGTGIVMATSKWWATLQRCQRLQTCISQVVVDANKNEVRVIQECPRIRFEN